MKQFKVYKHEESGALEAVKQGFSWPAFFFGLIWAIIKRLWIVALILALISLVSSGLMVTFVEQGMLNSQAADTFLYLVNLGVALVLGTQGNVLREKALEQRGYQFKQRLDAANPEAALTIYAVAAEKEKVVNDHLVA